jgi:AcrR family transcriptional regulator
MGSRATGAALAADAQHPDPSDDAARSPEVSRRGRTRERLLDAAYDVFAELGVHVATVEQITERAGFTRGAFYSNFTTKEELFFALMERENGMRTATLSDQLEVLQPRIGAALAAHDDVALGDVVLDLFVGPFDDRKWCLVQGEFKMLAMRDRAVAAQLLAYQGRFVTSLLPVLERAIAQAGREFVLDTTATLGLLSSVYERAVEAAVLAGQEVRDSERLRTDLARTVLVLTRPSTGSPRA